jgi:hypothetical protein
MLHGARAWILLVKAATAFLLTSAFLKLLTAGVMQAVRWKATKKPDRSPEDETDSEEMEETVETIRTASAIPETSETVAS